MTRVCDECGSADDSVEKVKMSSGRDYGGVGGAPSPPRYAWLCLDCRVEELGLGREEHI